MAVEKIGQIFKCEICGNVVEVVHVGGPIPVCCGQPMNLLKEKTTDEGNEKHVPIIEKTATGVKVKVGSVPHPMEEKHFIEWIEILADGSSCKKFLKPGQAAEAEFETIAVSITARIFCNLHDLWKSK